MQCPKCDYHAPLSEITVAGQCPKCAIYYHKFSKKPVQAASTFPAQVKPKRYMLILVSLFLVVMTGVLGYWGYGQYQRYQLIAVIDGKLRLANGYVAEIMDKKSGLTNAGYFEKVPRRIVDLDNLMAATLTVDDSAIPGIKTAAADYVNASRAFLSQFTLSTKASIQQAVSAAKHKAYEGYAASPEGLKYLAKSDAQIKAEQDYSLRMLEAAPDLLSKLEQQALIIPFAQQTDKRASYLKSLHEMNAARAEAELQLAALGQAGLQLKTIGAQLNLMAGKPLSVQAWMLE
jgi:hypothetical protein